jgi:hypothetical protein
MYAYLSDASHSDQSFGDLFICSIPKKLCRKLTRKEMLGKGFN